MVVWFFVLGLIKNAGEGAGVKPCGAGVKP